MEVCIMAENENAAKAGPKPVTVKTRFLYGIGDWAFSLMSNVETFFFNYFLTNIAQFSGPVVTTIATITSTVDAALSWIYGAILNIVKPGKYGRYRTWLVYVPWIVPFLFVFQFLKLGENDAVSAVIIVIAFLISHIVWNLPWSANVALISVAGGTPEGRAALSSSRATWNQVASITWTYVGWPLAVIISAFLTKSGIGKEVIIQAGANKYPINTGGFAALAFLLGCLMVLCYFVNFLATTGYEEIETAETLAKKKSKTKASGGEMLKSLIQNPSLCFLIFGTVPALGLRFIPPVVVAYYLQYVAQDMGMMVPYQLITALCAFAGAFSSGFIAKQFSARSTLIGSYVLAAVACVLIYFNYLNAWLVVGLMACVQFVQGICYSVYPALFADCAVYAKWKLNADARGWIMGLATVPLKVSIIGRSLIVNLSLMAIGFNAAAMRANPELVTEEVKKGITSAFALIPGIIVIVGIVIMIFGYRLTREKVNQYQKEIDARGGN